MTVTTQLCLELGLKMCGAVSPLHYVFMVWCISTGSTSAFSVNNKLEGWIQIVRSWNNAMNMEEITILIHTNI
jgi:hypothetical protein